MKLALATTVLLLGSQGVTSLSIPFTSQFDLIERDADPALVDAQFIDLEKRRGGGGGRGGGSSSSGSSSGGSSGGRSGSSSSSGSSSGSSRGGSSSSSSGRTSSSSNRGGSSAGGSGVSPSYGGGRYDSSNPSPGTTYGFAEWQWWWIFVALAVEYRVQQYHQREDPQATDPPIKTSKAKTFGNNRYYAGGARSPYTAGSRSISGITPFLLPAAALAFFPGVWLAGAYAYPYTHPYLYHDNNNNKNESLPVVCLCEEYQECGCDDNNNSTYYEALFNGTQPHNTSVARVVNVNGTEKIVINGTLANGTTADDGTSSSTSGAAPSSLVTLANASGYWVMVAVVAATVWSF